VGFCGETAVCENGRFACKVDWGGEYQIALWVLRDWVFVNNGRFAYVKLGGAGNLRLPCGIWESGVLWGNGRL